MELLLLVQTLQIPVCGLSCIHRSLVELCPLPWFAACIQQQEISDARHLSKLCHHAFVQYMLSFFFGGRKFLHFLGGGEEGLLNQ